MKYFADFERKARLSLAQEIGEYMFTIETKQMDIIINNVRSEKAKDSLYHMLINYEIYKLTAEMPDENMEKLNFYNFAKTQTCHINV